jgi:hypothetical protein
MTLTPVVVVLALTALLLASYFFTLVKRVDEALSVYLRATLALLGVLFCLISLFTAGGPRWNSQIGMSPKTFATFMTGAFGVLSLIVGWFMENRSRQIRKGGCGYTLKLWGVTFLVLAFCIQAGVIEK